MRERDKRNKQRLFKRIRMSDVASMGGCSVCGRRHSTLCVQHELRIRAEGPSRPAVQQQHGAQKPVGGAQKRAGRTEEGSADSFQLETDRQAG